MWTGGPRRRGAGRAAGQGGAQARGRTTELRGRARSLSLHSRGGWRPPAWPPDARPRSEARLRTTSTWSRGAASQPPPLSLPPPPLEAALSGRLPLHELPCGTTWADAFRDSSTLTLKQATLAAHPELLELYPSPETPISVFAVSDRAYINIAASFQAAEGNMPALDSLESQILLGKVSGRGMVVCV